MSWFELITVILFGTCAWYVYERHLSNKFRHESYHALATLVQHSHPETESHLARVADQAYQLARQLKLSKNRATLVSEAALLHDIGKIAIDERILDKPAKLDAQELKAVRKHPEFGTKILEPFVHARQISKWIQLHHERLDGGGYPIGLMGDSIPLESKIIAVVDAYDAMTGEDSNGQGRAYRKSISPSEALEELKRCSGTQFCPEVVRKFEKIINREVNFAR